MKKPKLPEWYWSHGLHDANILSATIKEKNGVPCLVVTLDCDGSLGEQDITEIRFYQCKIKTPCFNLDLLTGGWWLWDELFQKDGWYKLILEFDTENCNRKTLDFTFHHAEVLRG